MTSTLLRSSGMSSNGPMPKRWTCAEFHRIGDAGAFAGRRAMLIDGIILEEGPMNPPHAITLGLVEDAVRNAFGTGWWLRNQMPLILGQDIDPEPDLAVVIGRPRDYREHPTAAELVIEVADTSIDFDTQAKRQIYARAGIREYWVVDINARVLHVYRDPLDGDYQRQERAFPTDSIAPLGMPTAIIPLFDMFP